MNVLLLAGTGLAQQIADHLKDRNIATIFSLAGGARKAGPADAQTRVGGFGGEEGFRDFLQGHDISAVIDATHPFASAITERTARICAEQHIPFCVAQRPEWQPQPEDRWTMIAREEDAATHIDPGCTVFLATGRQTLQNFANLSHSTLICRQIDPPDGPFPFDNGRFLVGTPPFSVAQEQELFAELGIDWLIVKNAGGTASKTKLTAARNLGVRVAMITRPPLPDAPVLRDAVAAVEWLAAQ